MKNYLLLLCVFISSCVHKTTDLNIYQLKGNISSVKISFYEANDKFGKIIKGDYYEYSDFNGQVKIIEFNESGYINFISRYRKNGELEKKDVYLYQNEQVNSITSYDSNGDLIDKTVKKWDNNKLLSSIVYTKNGKEDIKFVYEYENDKLKSQTYYEESELKSKSIITKYDGDLVGEETFYDADGKIVDTAISKWENNELVKYTSNSFSYTLEIDKNGLVVKSENCYVVMNLNDLTQSGVYYYEYEYDKKDNWIKCTTFKGELKQPFQIIEREITYRQ